MNLRNKKILAAKTLDVGKGRIIFLPQRLEEIKEAITKQDIKDLLKDGAIRIKEKRGRIAKKKKRKRNQGKIKKRVNKRKREYVTITRRLRMYLSEMRKQKELSKEDIEGIRNKIKNRIFKSKSDMKEYIETK